MININNTILLLFLFNIFTINYAKKLIEFNDNNFVSLRGDINEENSLKFIQEITQINSNIINVYINSDGGSVENGLEIINVFINLQYKDIIINCIANKAYSMGFVILQACNNRYATPHATFMQHQVALNNNGGKLYDVNKYLKHINNIDYDMDIIQANKINMDINDFKNKIVSDWWLTTKEALKYNVIDDIAIIDCKTIKKNCYY